MIVRNESARIERCLASVAEHINCWAICDTGSDDGTPDLIQRFFAERNIPGEIFHAPFHDFSQARNAALTFARCSTLDFDYLLLCDADMELVAEGPLPDLTASAYRVIQRGGDLTYWNTRLLRRDAKAEYIGVTHEYLSVEGIAQIGEWWFRDHADGANRKDKFDRDIRLLTMAIQKDPTDARSWYYLGQSQKDAGRLGIAAKSYLRRAEMGGWKEEVWSACLNAARCMRDCDDPKFERHALAAYAQRPQRAEPLLDLARFHRERGNNAAALLFADAGKSIPFPKDDLLFVEHDAYSWGFDQEISIAGCYLPDRVADGRAACESLALRRDVPAHVRDLARQNLYWYYQPLTELAPSFSEKPVDFTPPEGWNALNPSVAVVDGELLMTQRAVNYTIGEDQRYIMPAGEPIRTRNFLLELNFDLSVSKQVELIIQESPFSLYNEVVGFEDLRLFASLNETWAIATAREFNSYGLAEQMLCYIHDNKYFYYIKTLKVNDIPRWHQKNWMPYHDGSDLYLVYLCDPTRILDENGNTLVLKTPVIAADNFRGGSQAIEHEIEGQAGWLCVIHESYWQPVRHYRHRFVWFDKEWNLARVSPSFYLRGKQIEYVAGLCRHRGDLLLSFGVNDRESWLGSIASADVDRLLKAPDVRREN